jgi:hypothetical protein
MNRLVVYFLLPTSYYLLHSYSFLCCPRPLKGSPKPTFPNYLISHFCLLTTYFLLPTSYVFTLPPLYLSNSPKGENLPASYPFPKLLSSIVKLFNYSNCLYLKHLIPLLPPPPRLPLRSCLTATYWQAGGQANGEPYVHIFKLSHFQIFKLFKTSNK